MEVKSETLYAILLWKLKYKLSKASHDALPKMIAVYILQRI